MGASAQEWYRDNHTFWINLDEFKAAFRLRSLTHAIKAKARASAKDFRRGHYQSVEDVVSTLNRLYQAAIMTYDETKKDCVLRALLPAIRREMLRRSPIDYVEACRPSRRQYGFSG
ncbi:hypothetical protein BGZ83_007725 [Gryganskiella cystojenkinii]|nr:hypothetical protein BGZ83_007725 [Gryganskiella cystojenkinii]